MSNVVFSRKILESLGTNKDMLTALILAATADTGRGVKICAGLWPHLTPPARVGGVARALVKAGLLSPAPNRGPGWYFVKTQADSAEQAPARRAGGEAEAKQQRQTSERKATNKQSESAEIAAAREAALDNAMQTSEAVALIQQSESEQQASSKQTKSSVKAAQQQAESSAEAKQDSDEIDPADLDELASLPTPFLFDDNQPEFLNKPQKAMSPLEIRARKIAEKECPTGQDFEEFFEQNRLKFIVAARA